MGQLIQRLVGRLRQLHPAWILSVLAVVVTAGGLYLLRENRALRARAVEMTREIGALRVQARLAYDRAAAIERRATELDSQLGSAKSQSTATGTKNTQLSREVTELKTRLSRRAQSEIALMTELAIMKQKLAEAGSAAKPPAISPPEIGTAPAPSAAPSTPSQGEAEIEAYTRRIAQLEQQLTELLTRAIDGTPAEATPPAAAPTPAPPPDHTVVRVGPRDSFVIIDYGAEHGAAAGMIISIWRGTSVLAHVRISDARPRFSIAQVLPASLKGQLQPGDIVLLKQ